MDRDDPHAAQKVLDDLHLLSRAEGHKARRVVEAQHPGARVADLAGRLLGEDEHAYRREGAARAQRGGEHEAGRLGELMREAAEILEAVGAARDEEGGRRGDAEPRVVGFARRLGVAQRVGKHDEGDGVPMHVGRANVPGAEGGEADPSEPIALQLRRPEPRGGEGDGRPPRRGAARPRPPQC